MQSIVSDAVPLKKIMAAIAHSISKDCVVLKVMRYSY